MSVSAIVLAGGRSARFGRDKLAEPIDGRPLLGRAVEAVAGLAEETIVVLSPAGPVPALGPTVRIARDPEPFGGPLVGLVAGLEMAVHDRILVVGGDMPSMERAVLRLLLDTLDGSLATALEDDDTVRPLPAAVRRATALATARVLVAAGTRSLRALLTELDASVIAATSWRPLDPEAATVRDIDVPADLEG